MRYCEYCRVFYQDNAAAVARHERGASHRRNVQQAQQRIKQERERSEQSHVSALSELHRVQRAALAQYARDTASASRPEDCGSAVGESAKLAHSPPSRSPLFQSGNASTANYADTAFGLGFGTNHPKYEASRTRQGASARARVERSMNGEQLHASFPNAPSSAGSSTPGKRKRKRDMREHDASASTVNLSQAEADAQAKREAARKRVQQRTAAYMGMQANADRSR